jgi:hypothetical protein
MFELWWVRGLCATITSSLILGRDIRATSIFLRGRTGGGWWQRHRRVDSGLVLSKKTDCGVM